MKGKRAGEDCLGGARAVAAGWPEAGGGRHGHFALARAGDRSRGGAWRLGACGGPGPSSEGAPRELRRAPGRLPRRARARSEFKLVRPGAKLRAHGTSQPGVGDEERPAIKQHAGLCLHARLLAADAYYLRQAAACKTESVESVARVGDQRLPEVLCRFGNNGATGPIRRSFRFRSRSPRSSLPSLPLTPEVRSSAFLPPPRWQQLKTSYCCRGSPSCSKPANSF